MTGTAASDQFGFSVSSAGDVNSDGYSDVIVGANVNDAGGTDAGRAYIYFGGNSPDTIPDVIMTEQLQVINSEYLFLLQEM
ncbi:MAG: FG-GAP repeat protein [Ignavibacteria bacterium]|nr:FG-GAP repeat protein [Ignavibacteria bacterium]